LRNRIPKAEDPGSNPETSDDPELHGCKDCGEDLGSYDPESQSEDNIVAKPYNLLLQSLVTSKKSSKGNPQRRNLDHTQTEEDGTILEDSEDLANEPEEEEQPEEEVRDLGSDNGDQSDPFESHFASPSPSRLASISSTSQREWKNTKLPKSRLLRNTYLSVPGGSEQATGGRRIEGLKNLNLKKKLVAKELTPLRKSLGQLVFNYVDVLYGERTLGNAEELLRMYFLHALNHVLRYVPTQAPDHLHTNQNLGPEADS